MQKMVGKAKLKHTFTGILRELGFLGKFIKSPSPEQDTALLILKPVSSTAQIADILTKTNVTLCRVQGNISKIPFP